MSKTDTEHVWDLLSDSDVCMLVTQIGGSLRSRPMSSIPIREDGRIYFLTDEKARVDDEIVANSSVLLAYANSSSTYISVMGQGAVSGDRQLIKRLWSTDAQAFWPEGPEAARVRVLVVTPTETEIWEGPGGLVAAAKMVFAAATGSQPDLGEKKRVAMGPR